MATLTTRDRVLRLVREPRRLPAALRRRLLPTAPVTAAERVGSANGAAPPPGPLALGRADRLRLITEHVDLGGLGLEIGASHNPLLRKSAGYNVRTADYLDQQDLVEKYRGVRPTGAIEEVDYVLSSGRLSGEIPDRFDYIVASHVGEHTVCLISFLQECQTLLEPGGVLSLVLPDRRYCFDRFRERTSLGRVVDVYRAAPDVHSEGSVLEHHLCMVNKGGVPSWHDGAAGEYAFRYALQAAQEQAASAARGAYVDTHNWVFTPNHFRLLIDDLHRLGFVGLRELTFHGTVGTEFFVTLTAEADGPGLSRAELVTAAAAEAAVPEVVAFA